MPTEAMDGIFGLISIMENKHEAKLIGCQNTLILAKFPAQMYYDFFWN
jgi:hypothetical protein